GAVFSDEIATPHPPASPSTFPQGSGEVSARFGHSLDVAITGSNLFAREFGALDAAADPVIAPALSRLKRRSR
ncbi:MAG: hypothetical protein J0H21_05180, partial [Rhizobiales bacterium]|nr:hypothetical protein [Hyphomicrobiales bacterium]